MRTALRSHTPDEPYATPPAATYAAPRGAYGAARATAGVAAEVLATRHGQPRVSLLVQPGRRHSCPQWWRTGDRGGDQTQLRHHVVLASSDQAEIAVPPSAPLPHSRKRRGLRGSCRRSRSFCFWTPTRLLAAIPARRGLQVSAGRPSPVSQIATSGVLSAWARDAWPGALAMSHRCVTAAVVARLPYLTHVLDRPTSQKGGWAQVGRTAVLPPGDRRPGREDGRLHRGSTLARRPAHRRARARRGRTPRGGRRGRRSTRRSCPQRRRRG